jgi:hypothetical protein
MKKLILIFLLFPALVIAAPQDKTTADIAITDAETFLRDWKSCAGGWMMPVTVGDGKGQIVKSENWYIEQVINAMRDYRDFLDEANQRKHIPREQIDAGYKMIDGVSKGLVGTLTGRLDGAVINSPLPCR